MDKYEKLEKLGEGAHGVVAKARVRSKEEIVADRRAHRLKQQQLLLEEEKESSSTTTQVKTRRTATARLRRWTTCESDTT